MAANQILVAIRATIKTSPTMMVHQAADLLRISGRIPAKEGDANPLVLSRHISPVALVGQRGDLGHAPDVIGNPRHHRGGSRVGVGKRRVQPREVVVEEVRGDGRKCRAMAAMWLATFLENPLVSRVNLRIPIRIVRFWRVRGIDHH